MSDPHDGWRAGAGEGMEFYAMSGNGMLLLAHGQDYDEVYGIAKGYGHFSIGRRLIGAPVTIPEHMALHRPGGIYR